MIKIEPEAKNYIL